MITLIDYGMGNLRSVQKALENVGGTVTISSRAADILAADKVVLPGVGAMNSAVDRLYNLDLVDAIKATIDQKKPFLGICLGYQLLFDQSDEGGQTQGLGILKGQVKRFPSLKIPQMGWNQLEFNAECPLFKGLPAKADMYFCHSYYVVPDDPLIISSTTDYGISYASSIWTENIYAMQFHPEKSQQDGLHILKNFVDLPS